METVDETVQSPGSVDNYTRYGCHNTSIICKFIILYTIVLVKSKTILLVVEISSLFSVSSSSSASSALDVVAGSGRFVGGESVAGWK